MKQSYWSVPEGFAHEMGHFKFCMGSDYVEDTTVCQCGHSNMARHWGNHNNYCVDSDHERDTTPGATPTFLPSALTQAVIAGKAVHWDNVTFDNHDYVNFDFNNLMGVIRVHQEWSMTLKQDRRWSLLCACLVIGQAACSESKNIEGTSHPRATGPAMPPPRFRLEVADLTTSAGQGPFRVSVSNWGRPVGATTLGRIAQAVELKTWPEGTALPVRVAQIVDTTGAHGVDEEAHIYVEPTQPLPDRWYALWVNSVPQDTQACDCRDTTRLGGGARVARFRVGSEPVVSLVTAESKKPGGVPAYLAQVASPDLYLAEVHFSEGVGGDKTLVEFAYADGFGLSCAPYIPRPPVDGTYTPDSGAPGAGLLPADPTQLPDPYFNWVLLTCNAPFDFTRSIRVEVKAGLSSRTGAPVAPTEFLIGAGRWLTEADGVRVFTPL